MHRHQRPRTFDELCAEHGRQRAVRGYRRAHRGIWVPEGAVETESSRLEALTVVCPKVVATGWTAAAIHGHPWLPRSFPLEVTSRTQQVKRPGVLCRRYDVPEEHVVTFVGPGGGLIRVASVTWTLFDLGRHLPLGEAVPALDAADHPHLTRRCDPRRDFPVLLADHPRLRHRNKALAAAARTDLRSESRMESVTRLFVEDAGFDCFTSQVRVPGTWYRLDLAAEEYRLGVEYDGAYHRNAAQHAADLRRTNHLRAVGWDRIGVTASMLYDHPDELVAHISRALRERGWPGPCR